MAKSDDIPKTDPSEIEALVQRLKQSKLEPRDVQLVERLLRLVLLMASVVRQKSVRPAFSRTSSGCPPLVPMVQSTDFGDLDHYSQSGGCFARGSGASFDNAIWVRD
jgi:hypothetical protein